MSRRKVAVIGGGAAGMMAAIFAARHGDAVTVFEKNAKIGRKLYITGKGRCNLTNNCDSKTVIENTPTNGRFLYSALNRFSPADTMRFFEENGLPLKTERGHRVFPVSDKAADVVDTLLHTAKREGVQITFQRVDELLIKDGTVIGLKTGTKELLFDKVIVACGGCSYPLTGSTGDGYHFARQAGHTVTTLKPSLVPLETEEIIPAEMVQLLLKNVALTVIDTRQGGKKLYTDFGELQFMRYGVAGAVMLSASAHMKEMSPERYRLLIDLKPALSEEKLEARLLREINARHRETVSSLLRSLLPAAMLMLFLSKAGLSPDKNCSEITRTERRQLLMLLKAFPLTVKGFRPIEEAIVTSGGVSVREIDPKTMASKLVKGLYFAGEVIDVDAYTGGFNLQCAFATGVLAGEA
ncbi:MAG: NAD(P)/FAD-dependent oxidoreductase [Acutalibacteraceae bacterium]|nr:NAD(P)/FAD-dependent oxidoreductase [Acutalibacteraceae bacterium]